MTFLTKLSMIAILASTTVAAAEAPPPPAPEPKRVEISKAEGEKFLVFFNKMVDAIVQNKEDCPKMAAAITVVVDTNQAVIKKANDAKAAGKKLPKAIEDKMMARIKDEMMPAMQKCGGDADVQVAMNRMDKPSAPAAKPAPKK
jgi:hypothetical protein